MTSSIAMGSNTTHYGNHRHCSPRTRISNQVVLHIMAAPSVPQTGPGDTLPPNRAHPPRLLEKLHLILPSEILVNKENTSKLLEILQNNLVLQTRPNNKLIVNLCACLCKLVKQSENAPYRQRKILIKHKAFESVNM